MTLSIPRTPVNKSASMVFWKSPWWAKVSPDTKAAAKKVVEKFDYKTLLDYTSPPPARPGNSNSQIKDKRGFRVTKNSIDKGTVIGFADSVVFRATKKGFRRKMFWWVLTDDAEIIRVRDYNTGDPLSCAKFHDDS